MSIQEEIPLKPAVYLVLLVLRAGACHGYAIRKKVLAHSEQRIRLDPGSLYRLIARLLDSGWIREVEIEDADPRRRYYALTSTGIRLLELESNRMARMVRLAREFGLVREGEQTS